MLDFIGVHRQLGSLSQTNKDIEFDVKWSADEIFKKTGIKKRFISAIDETAESLAIKAVNKFTAKELEDVDLIVGVTNTPNIKFPNLSHYVLSSSNFSENVQCIGLNHGCSGFVDALEIVFTYFESLKKNKALIVTSDTYQKLIPKEDRSIRTLFSDGACATLLQNNNSGFKIKKTIHHSKAQTEKFLISKLANGIETINMNGPQVLAYSLSIGKEIKPILDNEKKLLFIPHQAGKIVLNNLKKIADENDVTILTNYEDYGNLVSSSIPNVLHDNFDNFKKYKNVLLSGFGVGLKHTTIHLVK